MYIAMTSGHTRAAPGMHAKREGRVIITAHRDHVRLGEATVRVLCISDVNITVRGGCPQNQAQPQKGQGI